MTSQWCEIFASPTIARSPLWLFLLFTHTSMPPAQSNPIPTVRHARRVRVLTDRFVGRHLSRASTVYPDGCFHFRRHVCRCTAKQITDSRATAKSGHADSVCLSVNLTLADTAPEHVRTSCRARRHRCGVFGPLLSPCGGDRESIFAKRSLTGRTRVRYGASTCVREKRKKKGSEKGCAWQVVSSGSRFGQDGLLPKYLKTIERAASARHNGSCDYHPNFGTERKRHGAGFVE